MAAAITTSDVKRAAVELDSMRGALKRWLHYRTLNDGVLAGTVPVKKPLAYAQRTVAARRDMASEQDLANKLIALLGVTLPGVPLPSANLSTNPTGAVQLATIAITGQAPAAAAAAPAPSGVGGFPGAGHPWLWPVLIVGGLVVMVTTAIKTAADVAATNEQTACIEAGACTDYGFWLKAGGVAALAWVAWREFGVGEIVRNALHKRGR